MSSEERRDSLADQAAAWVPPWERPPLPREPAPIENTGPVESTAPVEAVAPVQESAPVESAAPAEDVAGAADAPVETTAPVEGVAPGEAAGPVTEAARKQPVVEPGPAVDVPGEPAARTGRRAATRNQRPPAPEPELPALADDAELRGALEAVLLVVDQPVAEIVLAQVLEQPTERVAAMLDRISADYTAAGHGFDLRRAAGGWRLYTRPEYAVYVERFVLDGQSVRLTQAALEALAVVAYKQPVTRSRISAIRGVNCDGVIRTLVSRGLVEECGTEPDSGAFLYRTTVLFLEKLGLNTVDELPPLAPFLPDDVEEIADAQR